jgi:hypothetical protein
MKNILLSIIIISFCSCSSGIYINGVQAKRTKKVTGKDVRYVAMLCVVGCFIGNTFQFHDEHGNIFDVVYNVFMKNWRVSQNGAPLYTTPNLQTDMVLNDDTALRILKRALKID